MGPDTENRVGVHDVGSTDRLVFSLMQLPGEPEFVVQGKDSLAELHVEVNFKRFVNCTSRDE